MLCDTGELKSTSNLGQHDLESAAEELFVNRCYGVEPTEPCSEIAVPQWRDFTDEEVEAVKWKLKMHKSPTSSIVKFMTRLTEASLSRTVTQYKSVVAEPPEPKAKPPKFILGRDKQWCDKKKSLHVFLIGIVRSMA